MADDGESVQLGLADELAVVAGQGPGQAAVVFKTREGVSGAVLSPDLVSALVARLINLASSSAATVTPEQPPSEMTAVPIPVQFLGWAPGRHDQEALLSIRSGDLNLALSVDATMLVELSRDILSKAKPVPKPTLS